MVSFTIRFNYISAERMMEWVPPGIQFQTQLTIPSGDVESKGGKLKVPFVFSLTCTPPVATLTLKGYVLIEGAKEEVEEIKEKIKQKKPPQPILMATLHHSMVEAIIITREIGVPPPVPLPKIGVEPQAKKGYTGLQTI